MSKHQVDANNLGNNAWIAPLSAQTLMVSWLRISGAILAAR
jgi:hypothetical protein